MPGSPSQTWVEVGRVERTRGLDGSLLIRLHAGDPANLLAAPEVALEGGPGRIPFRVLEARAHGQRIELRLAGLASRETAREWTGARVSIARSALPSLPEGEYYWRDLIGLAVRTADGRSLGILQEIWDTAGHDVLVVATAGDPVLIPAVEPALLRIDLAAREIVIDPAAGVLPDDP